MYADLAIKDYLRETASSTPVPGGGSVAALSASLAAALVEMVAGLTAGRSGFEAVAPEMENILHTAAALRSRCVEDIDRDADAYRQVLVAYRLPKANAADKAVRSRAIQAALKQASLVPLALAERARKILELAGEVVRKGNPNAVSDGAVAAMLARSAGLAAICNVRINLTSVSDADFAADTLRKIDRLEQELVNREEKIRRALPA
ncbi:MAG: cyclodeaminase/cyclohydrolase family protein [Deltaproteobacteria bacterium]|nr:cyclodeaminase/cyclohydrolase family protein [Deltaproteobacteria bacterium]